MRIILALLMIFSVSAFASDESCSSNSRIKEITTLSEDELSQFMKESHVDWKQKNDTLYVLNFWASWCAPCRAELPMLDILNQESDIEVITINIGDPDDRLKSIFEEIGIKTLPTYQVDHFDGFKGIAFVGLPTSFFFLNDTKGLLVGKLEEKELRDWFKCLTKKEKE